MALSIIITAIFVYLILMFILRKLFEKVFMVLFFILSALFGLALLYLMFKGA